MWNVMETFQFRWNESSGFINHSSFHSRYDHYDAFFCPLIRWKLKTKMFRYLLRMMMFSTFTNLWSAHCRKNCPTRKKKFFRIDHRWLINKLNIEPMYWTMSFAINYSNMQVFLYAEMSKQIFLFMIMIHVARSDDVARKLLKQKRAYSLKRFFVCKITSYSHP